MHASGKSTLRIGAFARLAGTNLRTLRYYEELGLLRCARRSRGGFRFYDRGDLGRIEAIRRLQAIGLPLSKIRKILRIPCCSDRTDMLRRAGTALEEQKKLLATQVARLETQLREIDRSLHHLRECRSCPMLPPIGEPYCSPCRVDGKEIPGPFRALLE